MSYTFQRVTEKERLYALEPMFKQHWDETRARLGKDGIELGEWAPAPVWLPDGIETGYTRFHTVSHDGEPVGYFIVTISRHLMSGEWIGMEQGVYVVPEHRKGVGRKLIRHTLDDLRATGVAHLLAHAVTDPRVAKLWQRMGFKAMSTQMIYQFKEAS